MRLWLLGPLEPLKLLEPWAVAVSATALRFELPPRDQQEEAPVVSEQWRRDYVRFHEAPGEVPGHLGLRSVGKAQGAAMSYDSSRQMAPLAVL